MENLVQFGALLVSIIGVFVALFVMLLKINRNSATKEDLNNSIGILRSEMNKRFEEVDRRFAEAAADREKIRMEVREGFAEAAADREKIRMEMREGFAEAAADREKIRMEVREGLAEAAADREKIRMEIRERSTAASVERKRIEEQAREDRKEIKSELSRQNQNYIEHLAHHGSPRANLLTEDEGGA